MMFKMKRTLMFTALLVLTLLLFSGCGAKSAATSLEPPPSFVATAEDYGAVYVRWEEAKDAEKYIVYRRTFDENANSWGDWEKIYTNKNRSFTDTDITVGTKYAYRAKCVDSSGEKSEYSTVCEVTAKEATIPFVSVKAETKDCVTVSLRAVEGVERYHIYRRVYDASKKAWGDWASLAETDTVSYLDKSVSSGVKYGYRATAVRADGTETGFSNGANVTVP